MSSVRLSVTLVDQDHKGWKSWKISTRKISPTPSLFVGQKPSTYSQGNMGKLGETRGAVGKSGVLEHKSGSISETRKDMEKLLWIACRKSQTFFRTVHLLVNTLENFQGSHILGASRSHLSYSVIFLLFS